MRNIAVFDFDGTLTTRDSFLEFIRFCLGLQKLILGLIVHLPMICLMKVNLLPNQKVKECLFSWFFKGFEYDKFMQLGSDFANVVQEFANQKTTKILQKHALKGDDIFVITASIEEWVRPYCERINVGTVIGTRAEVIDGRLTGRFSTPNCYGKEKVSRLLDIEPKRSTYHLYAYGDSRGDRELINFADEGYYV